MQSRHVIWKSANEFYLQGSRPCIKLGRPPPLNSFGKTLNNEHGMQKIHTSIWFNLNNWTLGTISRRYNPLAARSTLLHRGTCQPSLYHHQQPWEKHHLDLLERCSTDLHNNKFRNNSRYQCVKNFWHGLHFVNLTTDDLSLSRHKVRHLSATSNRPSCKNSTTRVVLSCFQ